MSEWAIVAIPEDEDRVWRVSSEDVPHMTLLYFGEQSNNEIAMHVAAQLQHAVKTSLTSFYAPVHSRGTLGENEADVLFFDQAELGKKVYDFRNLLLQDETIRKLYDSTDQYPSWTPHLTLGYPTRPAKKPKNTFDEGRFYSVLFDRIAFWFGNSDGPTFTMNVRPGHREGSPIAFDPYDTSVAMSDASREFLSHRNPEPVGEPNYMSIPSPSNLKHLGVGARSRSYMHPVMKAIQPALDRTLASTTAISEDVRYLRHSEDGGLLTDNPIQKQYIREHQVALAQNLKHCVGGRPSETANISFDVATLPNKDWVISMIDLMAHTGTAETCIRPHVDARGIITDYTIVANDVSQEDMRRAMIHYGVKGMKWGVRRKVSSAASSANSFAGQKVSAAKKSYSEKKDARKEKAATARAVKKEARKQNIRETIKRPVAAEAANAAQGRKRTEKHGTDSLSNAELQTLVTRMNLEQQYSALQANQKAASARSSGKTYVSEALKEAGQEVIREVAKEAAMAGLKYAFGQASEAAKNRNSSRSSSSSPSIFLPSERQRSIGR